MPDISHKAPLTLALMVRVEQLRKELSISIHEFRVFLNQHLPPKRQIKDNHAGTTKLYRWLNPTGSDWCEPRAEVALAMKVFVEECEKRLKK